MVGKLFRNPKEEAFRKLLRKGTGGYVQQYEANDLEAEGKFMVWMEARQSMARKPRGDSLVFLTLISIPEELINRADPEKGIIEGVMHEEKINFEWKEYQDLQETFKQMYKRAQQEPGTKYIRVQLLNIGDITEKLIREASIKKGQK